MKKKEKKEKKRKKRKKKKKKDFRARQNPRKPICVLKLLGVSGRSGRTGSSSSSSSTAAATASTAAFSITPTQNFFRVHKSVTLTCLRCLSHINKIHQPVTQGVQRIYALQRGPKLFGCILLHFSLLRETCFSFCSCRHLAT